VSKLDKWNRWLDGPIRRDVIGMHGQRWGYREVARIKKTHGELPPSSFFDYLGRWYATSQAVAVRRQAESSKQVTSLGSLIADVRDHAHLLTREWYVAMGEEEWQQHHQAQTFDRRFGGNVGGHVDPDAMQTLLDGLGAAAAETKKYVDRAIAHVDRRKSGLLTFAALNHAIDAVGETFNVCALLHVVKLAHA
jgi:hypothetical protein